MAGRAPSLRGDQAKGAQDQSGDPDPHGLAIKSRAEVHRTNRAVTATADHVAILMRYSLRGDVRATTTVTGGRFPGQEHSILESPGIRESVPCEPGVLGMVGAGTTGVLSRIVSMRDRALRRANPLAAAVPWWSSPSSSATGGSGSWGSTAPRGSSTASRSPWFTSAPTVGLPLLILLGSSRASGSSSGSSGPPGEPDAASSSIGAVSCIPRRSRVRRQHPTEVKVESRDSLAGTI